MRKRRKRRRRNRRRKRRRKKRRRTAQVKSRDPHQTWWGTRHVVQVVVGSSR